jgi:septal ring factor EnvC (AmiA/AmiB activator)
VGLIKFIAICAVLCASLAQAAPDREGELRQLRSHISELQRKLDKDQQDRGTQQQELDSIERRISGLHVSLSEARREIAQRNKRITELEKQRVTSEAQMLRQRGEISRLVYGSYLLGNNSHLKMMLNQEDPATLGRMLEYYRYLSAARVQRVERLQRSIQQLDEILSQLSAERRRLKEAEAEKLRQQQQLQARSAERRQILDRLEKKISSRSGELSRLKRDEQRLQRLVKGLREYLADLPPDVSSRKPFSDMRGRLRLPVRAQISARFGEPKAAGSGRWQGLLLNAEEGTSVHAVYRGRVAFADWLRGFGLLLILDHGDGYMSLYSHNQLLLKQVGDWVETSEPIARVGTSGGLREAGLYFEIRQNGRPRNPLRWCRTG